METGEFFRDSGLSVAGLRKAPFSKSGLRSKEGSCVKKGTRSKSGIDSSWEAAS